jgi:hypothetical protein
MIPMNSPAKLTHTQFAIPSEASHRKDRCLIPPKTLKAAAVRRVATKLLKAGLVREIKAKTGMEARRRDEETSRFHPWVRSFVLLARRCIGDERMLVQPRTLDCSVAELPPRSGT